jgi:DNA polymerase-3 subunit delta
VVRILESLKQEGTELTLILWALTREIRQLIAIAQTLAQGAALPAALAKHKVWEKRKAWVQRTLKMHSLQQLQLYLQKAAVIDSMIKGGEPGNVWEALLQLALNLTQDGFAIA